MRARRIGPRTLLVGAAFAVLALLRLLTLARDPWEWDEVLFTQAVRDGIDVRVNHPHPPGYPLFVRAGQAFHALGLEPFRAATAAGALGGFLSAWALYLFLAELRLRRPSALLGALFYALTPSVWLYGVRPFSDGLGAAMFLFASIYLVRALEGTPGPNLALGAAFSALAAGVRPQVALALLPAAALAAVCVYRRERRGRSLAIALCVAAAVTAAVWVPVFRSSGGFASWKANSERQMAYVARNDSPHAEDALRPEFWGRWMLDPAGGRAAAAVFLGLAVAGLVSTGRKRALVLLLLFAPAMALTIGVTGSDPAPRYALAFWPLLCALAAAALERAANTPHLSLAIAVASVVLLGALAIPAVPAIVEASAVPSPSVAVVKAARAAGIGASDIFVCPMLEVHAREYLGKGISVLVDARPESTPGGAVFLCADDVPTRAAPRLAYAYTSPLLPRISVGRYLRSGLWDGTAPARAKVRLVDDGIPASVEEPLEGARVTSPVSARGWCQERGGGRVDPVEFRIDASIYALPVTRVARPEVTEAIPEIGDPRIAGWEVTLPVLWPGRHTLQVTFQAGDRRRTYPERSFVVEEKAKP